MRVPSWEDEKKGKVSEVTKGKRVQQTGGSEEREECDQRKKASFEILEVMQV